MSELIGAMAVLAIIAAVAIPVAIRRIDIAAKMRETSDLAAISNGIALHILSTRTIPAPGGFAQAVANWTMLPLSRITNTPRRHVRSIVVDTGGWLNGTLPYVQSNAGTPSPPNNARVMVLSTMAKDLPAFMQTPQPSATEFQATWGVAEDNVPGTISWAMWGAAGGRGDELLIQRINVETLFHRLVLVNRDPGTANGMFSIDTNAPAGLTNVYRAYYLDGTDLGLFDGKNPANAQMRVKLDQDRTFVFQGGRWGDYLDPGDTYTDITGSEFAKVAAEFLQTEWYAGAHKGGNQQGTIVAMFNFMLSYQLWANQCPHFPTHNEASRNNVAEYQLMLDVGGNGASSLLNSFSGTDGLLK